MLPRRSRRRDPACVPHSGPTLVANAFWSAGGPYALDFTSIDATWSSCMWSPHVVPDRRRPQAVTPRRAPGRADTLAPSSRTSVTRLSSPRRLTLEMGTDARTITFVREKDTKNTTRFQEEPAPGQPPLIGTLYVAKWYVGDAQRLTVIVTKE